MRSLRAGAFALTLGFVLFFPFVTLADTLKPSSADVVITPGAVSSIVITQKNDGEVKKDYEVSFLRATFGESAEDIAFEALSDEQAAWFQPSESIFSLNAREEKALTIVLNVPATASPQVFTLAVLVKEKNTSESGVTLSSAGASLLFLYIGDGLEGNVQILSFDAVPGAFLSGEATVNALFKNTGNDTVILPDHLRVKNMFGQTVADTSLTDGPKRLPAGTVRSLTSVWPKEQSNPWLFGFYHFELLRGDTVIAEDQTFLLTAIPFGIAIFLMCDVILGILILVRKRSA
jgi:hypothetical protein